jgi:hypothetical protein
MDQGLEPFPPFRHALPPLSAPATLVVAGKLYLSVLY